jgi:hypothetical protein
MHNFGLATLVGTALAAALIGVAAPASAAPSGNGSAQDTVGALQSKGYQVILNKTGTAPLSQCTVVSVRPGHQFAPYTTRSDNSVVVHSVSTVYVDANC